jgi:hypothetical protein
MLVAAGLYMLLQLTDPVKLNSLTSRDERLTQAAKQLQVGGINGALASYLSQLPESICRETPALIFGVLAILAAGICLFVKQRKFPAKQTEQLLFIAIPALAYVLVIARIAPSLEDRYISLVFLPLGIVFYGLLYQAMKFLATKKWMRLLAVAVLSAFLLLGLRRTVYPPFYCYPHYQDIHNMYAEEIGDSDDVAVLYAYLTQNGNRQIVHHYQGVRSARYLQFLRYDNLDQYSPFPNDGKIIVIVGLFLSETIGGQDVADQLLAISGKSQATFMGYAVDHAEAWLLE